MLAQTVTDKTDPALLLTERSLTEDTGLETERSLTEDKVVVLKLLDADCELCTLGCWCASLSLSCYQLPKLFASKEQQKARPPQEFGLRSLKNSNPSLSITFQNICKASGDGKTMPEISPALHWISSREQLTELDVNNSQQKPKQEEMRHTDLNGLWQPKLPKAHKRAVMFHSCFHSFTCCWEFPVKVNYKYSP